jgi:REP element-mobilizing transposase RayT
MKTYTQILYQIVFSTKYRERTLDKSDRQALFQFIWGVLKNKRCHLYRINGVEDHLHIVTHLHPSVSLASLVKDIKLASSAYIKETGLFPHFRGWQDGYGAFTYSIESKHNLIEYVKRQEEHHKKESPREELIRLLKEQQVDFEEQYLDDYPPTDRSAVEPE